MVYRGTDNPLTLIRPKRKKQFENIIMLYFASVI